MSAKTIARPVVTKSGTDCPATDNGQHFVEWATRPAMFYNGQQVSGAERRGLCAWCDRMFIEQAD